VANADVWGAPADEGFSYNAVSEEPVVARYRIAQLGQHLMTGNDCLSPIVLKNSLRKFELVRSKKIGPQQSLSVGLNVQICTESNCHGRRDRKFGRPFVKTEFFNRIRRKLTFVRGATNRNIHFLTLASRLPIPWQLASPFPSPQKNRRWRGIVG
jgi:hypothetical protein